MLRTFKYRIYPTKSQRTKLEWTLAECCWLYNTLLNQRKLTYDRDGISLQYYDQNKYITKLKEFDTQLKDINAQVLEQVSLRLDLTFKNFFQRIKAAWLCLTGKVMVIGIIVSRKEFYKD